MADKPRNNATPPSIIQLIRSSRQRFGMQNFRRGRDRRWYFSGQQPDEVVRLVVRKHWWFLVRPALPFVGSVILFVLALSVSSMLPASLFWAWLVVDGLIFLVVLVTGAMFAYKDLISWWFETYIITNKRIINSQGLFQPTRQQTPVEKIQQVGIGVESMLGFLLGFGTIHIYLAGGDFMMENVPDPKKVRDAIHGISEEFKTKKPKDPEIPKPKDPTMAAILEQLAKGKPVPTLENADEEYPPLRNMEGFLGPRRTFGGFLRIPCDVRYFSGEYTVKYIQRSQYVLLRNLLVPALIILFVLPTMVLVPSTTTAIPDSLLVWWWLVLGLVIIGAIVSIGIIYMNFVDDVYILTNKRIIDIQRSFIFFAEERSETEYKNVRDIKVIVPNVIQRIFEIGNVVVETPANNPDIILYNVDNPFELQDQILSIKGHKEKEDRVRRENEEKKNLHMWFGTVVSKLEETSKSRGVPDLLYKDLLTAMSDAQAYGLDVVVSGEAVPNADIPPGCVVRQSPPPGTLMEKGSKIEIVLSKRPVLVNEATLSS
jgi:uncharacterized membrane protein YdbT with pleckstrin-like domain